MRDLDTRTARIFLAVAEEGSIAKAAAREHIVASAVSKRLKELEEALDVTLVERSQQGIQLTPAGEAMAHHARQVIRALDLMRVEMSEYGQGIRGVVRVRVSASALAVGLPQQIQSFLKQHQDIRLDLEELETPLIVREVAEGRAEVGICPGLFFDDRLEAFPFADYQLSIVVPEGHALGHETSVYYEQTLMYDHVEQPRTTALAQLVDYAAKQSSLLKTVRIRVRGFDAVCRMIGLGMGVGIVPSFLAETYGATYRLTFVPLVDSWAKPKICVICHQHEALSPAASAFLQHLKLI
jgi:DNA-binding transcriptional LysR family regulator